VVAPIINILRAGPDDIETVSRLSKVTFYETFKGTCTDDDMKYFLKNAFSDSNTLQDLKNENDFYFIALIDDVAAGYMRLKEDYTDYPDLPKYNAIELKRIYVFKDFQSQKIGAALMQYAVDFAKKKGYEAIWLGVWEHNEKAKFFYEKWGFTDTGKTHPFPIGNTPQTDNWLIKFIEKN
jgi:ribosomal protein S18 acetylase RimI-like enzyme